MVVVWRSRARGFDIKGGGGAGFESGVGKEAWETGVGEV